MSSSGFNLEFSQIWLKFTNFREDNQERQKEGKKKREQITALKRRLLGNDPGF
jgi:hypothetical protein